MRFEFDEKDNKVQIFIPNGDLLGFWDFNKNEGITYIPNEIIHRDSINWLNRIFGTLREKNRVNLEED